MTGSLTTWLRKADPGTPERLLQDGEEVGDFTATGFLGRGGNGEVYRALHRTTGASAAVKVLHNLSEETQERFRREINLLMTVFHPSLPRPSVPANTKAWPTSRSRNSSRGTCRQATRIPRSS